MTTFNDQRIERGQTIGPEFVKAIRESSVLIVVFSPNYPSSRWCLDELVEILKCKQDQGIVMMPIFYKIGPSHVRKQKGDFGRIFQKTCKGQTKEVKKIWSEALAHVGSIRGMAYENWVDEGAMVENIATYVSRLNDKFKE